MTTLNKNYTRIEGTDAVNTIDETNDTQLGEIEVDMGTLETDVTANEQATALNTTHRGLTNNPHTVTAAQVGKDTAQWNANEIQGIEVDTTGIADTNVLKYDSASGKLIAGAASVVANIDDLSDVVVTTPTDGDALLYNGSEWVNEPQSGSAIVTNEIPTGLINSSNTVYTTAYDFVANKIAIYLNRTRLKLDEDYTETDTNEVTLAVAPTTGDDLWVDYVRSDAVLVGDTSYRRVNETPTGLVNSSNTAYDTAEPFIAGTIEVYLNGQLQTLTADYAETDSNTITFVVAPVTGDTLRVSYQTALTPAGNADTLDGSHLAEILSILNPVGTIREFNVSTNPATLLGFGTWSAYGTGRVTVAIDAGQTEFDTVNETGGAKTHTLSLAETPNRTGQISMHDVANATTIASVSGAFSVGALSPRYFEQGAGTAGATSVGLINFNNGGGGGAHNNLQPYITVYRWVRTA